MSEKRPLTLGKTRALQNCANEAGIFTILAIDHRDSLRQMVKPDDLMAVPAQTLTDIKLDVVRALGRDATAVLLDPVYGMPQALASHTYPGGVGWIASLEAQGYVGNPRSRVTTLLPEWGIGKAKRLGANGVKMLLFYHPDSTAVADQHKLVESVVAECARYDVPLFLEPLLYALSETAEKGSEAFAKERPRLVIETARRFSQLGADILKIEFPMDCQLEQDQRAWADACAELNAAVTTPWTLLSAGEPFDIFQAQLRVACENGCSGFLVGRSLWREAVYLQGAKRQNFLQTTAWQRWQTLCEIAHEYGAPWHKRYIPQVADEEWYRRYEAV